MVNSTESDGEEPGLQEDRLVAALVPDPNEGPPNSTVLHVFVGKSTRTNRWRLYLDANLASYVEVGEDDILHHTRLPDEGGTLVWLPKSLKLEVTTVTSTSVQAEFLSGLIAAGRMGPTAQVRGGLAALAVPAPTLTCPSVYINCTTVGCRTVGCHTIDDWCPFTEFAPICFFG